MKFAYIFIWSLLTYLYEVCLPLHIYMEFAYIYTNTFQICALRWYKLFWHLKVMTWVCKVNNRLNVYSDYVFGVMRNSLFSARNVYFITLSMAFSYYFCTSFISMILLFCIMLFFETIIYSFQLLLFWTSFHIVLWLLQKWSIVVTTRTVVTICTCDVQCHSQCHYSSYNVQLTLRCT